MQLRCIEDVEKYLEVLEIKIKLLQKEKKLIQKKLKDNNVKVQIIKRKNLLEVHEGKIIVEL